MSFPGKYLWPRLPWSDKELGSTDDNTREFKLNSELSAVYMVGAIIVLNAQGLPLSMLLKVTICRFFGEKKLNHTKTHTFLNFTLPNEITGYHSPCIIAFVQANQISLFETFAL